MITQRAAPSRPVSMPPARTRAADPAAEPNQVADVDEQLTSLLDEATAPNAKILFYRWKSDAASWEYLEQLGAPDVQALGILETTKTRHGGGKFMARVRTAGKFGRSQTYNVAGEPRAIAAPRAAEPPAALTGPIGDDLGELLKRKALERLLDPPAARSFGLTEIAALVTALTPLLTTILKRGEPERDPMEIATKIAEMIREKSGGKSDMKDLIGAVKELVELKDLVGGDHGPAGDPVGEIARAVAPHVVDAFANAKRVDATRTTGAPAAAAIPSTTGAAPVATSTPAANEPAWITRLRPHIGMVAKLAASGQDPHRTANMVDLFVQGADRGILRELLMTENAEQLVLEAFPELAAYQAWTADFIHALRILFDLVDDEGSVE